ncbi:putative DNA-binding protein [Serpentinicella alkaliphila]|uniref:UPF0122 protein EDD79_100415 n=1 Tax=Serpentinicella alkaliphila TaxID=1734049 RepID=A0A4V2T4M8_9FIRM|nr:putative DNA-binding protein [Serpentinicella alkaliphila]QUH26257.1 putative DNA-binding protein [Serpentinicella alkaliphila]TCQ05834.1 hypothetical protein EDD79_100415 [Serpentinicella alkaliphila]
MIEKKIEISMLIDFYSQLLTEKQRDIIMFYYNDDLSLSEIAEEYSISRQAVYDTIKRTEKILYDYEEKLKLVELFQNKNKSIENILNDVIRLEEIIDDSTKRQEVKNEINRIKQLFYDLLNNS